MKELYTYTVNKIEKKETKVENTNGTLTISFVDESVPVKITLKKPSRKDSEDMAMVYHAEFHKCLSNKIGTEAMMHRAILDGGEDLIPKRDSERLHEIEKEVKDIINEIYHAKIDKLDTSEMEKSLQGLYMEAHDINYPQRIAARHTAESLATRKSLMWCALNLTFLKEGDKYTPLFSAPTPESKLSSYYDMSDEEEKYKFEIECFDKAYAFMEMFLSGNVQGKEDFEELERQFDEFLTKG